MSAIESGIAAILLAVAGAIWQWGWVALLIFGGVFLAVEAAFWLPLLVDMFRTRSAE